MNITHRVKDGALVIRLEGESLDATRTQLFKEQVKDSIEEHKIYQLVFDLEQLKFIDSSGLGAFLSMLRYVNANDGDLKLAGMSEPVHTMFQIVRMHKLFDIQPSVEDCCRLFAAHKA